MNDMFALPCNIVTSMRIVLYHIQIGKQSVNKYSILPIITIRNVSKNFHTFVDDFNKEQQILSEIFCLFVS